MATFKGLLKINENSISEGLLGPWKVQFKCVWLVVALNEEIEGGVGFCFFFFSVF